MEDFDSGFREIAAAAGVLLAAVMAVEAARLDRREEFAALRLMLGPGSPGLYFLHILLLHRPCCPTRGSGRGPIASRSFSYSTRLPIARLPSERAAYRSADRE